MREQREMRSRADKKGSSRKWGARGALLVAILLCGFLLAKCGDKPEAGLSGNGGAALSRESDPGKRLEPRGVDQPEAEAVMVKAEMENPAKIGGSLPQTERVDAKAMSQPDPSAGTEVEPALVQAQPLTSEDRIPESQGQESPEQHAENSPMQQEQKREDFPGEPQAALDDNDKNATMPDGEQGQLCPGAPTAEELEAKAKVPPGKTFIDPATRMSFVRVKGGCFRMGSDNGDSDEMPVHEVCVDDFYMGEFEVTQAQYEWIVGHNPSSFKRCDLPVESVTWEDAQAYIRKLNQVSGTSYRLPSEAEWEYAARSGWKEEAVAGFDPALAEYSGYIQNLGKQTPSWKRKPNALGLYDMNCNVWEWVSDWYGANYYESSPRTNPQGPLSGSRRVIRAGMGSRYEPRFAKRYGAAPDESYDHFGFRVAFPARFPVAGQREAQVLEIANSAAPTSQEDFSVSQVESSSGTASN